MMQIAEVLTKVSDDSEIISAQRQDRLSEEAVRRIEAQCAAPASAYDLWSEKRRPGACRLGEISREWSGQIASEPGRIQLAVLDDPIYFMPLMKTLKNCRIPVVGICHNLESLASQQVAADPRRSLFNQEIDLLAQCNIVITISREETFLLHNLGIHAEYFPYYPVEPILARLLQVRAGRVGTDKKGIFLLGNVLNLQTRQGMEKMIDFWGESKLFQDHGKLIVAGYSTGQYLKNVNGPAVEFYGELANDEMDRLLTRVKACLCFQETGSGALTRICEMLIAGVPVLANSHAARSYYNLNSVIEFVELKNLAGALKQAEKWDKEIPMPKAPDASGLIDEIKKAVMNNP